MVTHHKKTSKVKESERKRICSAAQHLKCLDPKNEQKFTERTNHKHNRVTPTCRHHNRASLKFYSNLLYFNVTKTNMSLIRSTSIKDF